MRLAVANLHRPGALTPSFLISLGLGITLLTALVGVEGNLRAEIGQSLPKDSPSFFFIDVQRAQAADFKAFLHKEAPDGEVAVAPMLRGRIVRVKDVPAEQVKPAEQARWALEGDRGVTFAEKPPAGSTVVAGAWWPGNYAGPPLVSMETDIARGLGLRVGDSISVNVLGRVLTAKIANLRKVNWRNFGINFVLVFSPNVFAGAPFTQLMTLTLPQRPQSRDRGGAAVRGGEGVSVRDQRLHARNPGDAGPLLGKLSVAIQSAASLAFVISALVLSGALAAGQRARVYESVVLKVLGATRAKLLSALALEFALLGPPPPLSACWRAASPPGWWRRRCWTWRSLFSRPRRRRSRGGRGLRHCHRSERNLAHSRRKAGAASREKNDKNVISALPVGVRENLVFYLRPRHIRQAETQRIIRGGFSVEFFARKPCPTLTATPRPGAGAMPGQALT